MNTARLKPLLAALLGGILLSPPLVAAGVHPAEPLEAPSPVPDSGFACDGSPLGFDGYVGIAFNSEARTARFRVEKLSNAATTATKNLRFTVYLLPTRRTSCAGGFGADGELAMAHRPFSPVAGLATVQNMDSGPLGLVQPIPAGGFYYLGLLVSELQSDGSYREKAFYAASYGLTVTSGSIPGGIPLSSERVDVEVTFRNQYSGERGKGYAIPQADGFVFFSFADPLNPEIFAKVLDFGGPGYLLFASGLTDLEYEVTFQSRKTGQKLTFSKPAGGTGGYVSNGELLE